MKKLLLTLTLILATTAAQAATVCTPRGDGGYICQDDGDYTVCTPRGDGGVICN